MESEKEVKSANRKEQNSLGFPFPGIFGNGNRKRKRLREHAIRPQMCGTGTIYCPFRTTFLGLCASISPPKLSFYDMELHRFDLSSGQFLW